MGVTASAFRTPAWWRASCGVPPSAYESFLPVASGLLTRNLVQYRKELLRGLLIELGSEGAVKKEACPMLRGECMFTARAFALGSDAVPPQHQGDLHKHEGQHRKNG